MDFTHPGGNTAFCSAKNAFESRKILYTMRGEKKVEKQQYGVRLRRAVSSSLTLSDTSVHYDGRLFVLCVR